MLWLYKTTFFTNIRANVKGTHQKKESILVSPKEGKNKSTLVTSEDKNTGHSTYN